MKRMVLASGLAGLLAAACGGGSSPTAPSEPIAAPGFFGMAVSPQSRAWPGTPNLAGCLSGAASDSCFSAARAGARAVVAGVTAPAAPLSLTSAVMGGTVTLTWSAPSTGDPPLSYVIEAGSGPGSADLANFSTNSTATTYSASSVGAGTYYVRVRAQNAGGISEPSNETIVTVMPGGCSGAPGTPGGLTASVNGRTVTLSWTAASGSPTTYMVEVGSAPGSSNLSISDLGGTSTTYTATAGSGTYYVRLRARNTCGTSAASNEITIVVGSPSTPNSIDGAWTGTTAQGRTYEMTVSGGAIRTIRYSHSACGTTTTTTTFNTPLAVTNGTFSTTIPGAGTSTTVSGTFTSNSSASGTLRISFTPIPFVQPCSGTFSTTWTATK